MELQYGLYFNFKQYCLMIFELMYLIIIITIRQVKYLGWDFWIFTSARMWNISINLDICNNQCESFADVEQDDTMIKFEEPGWCMSQSKKFVLFGRHNSYYKTITTYVSCVFNECIWKMGLKMSPQIQSTSWTHFKLDESHRDKYQCKICNKSYSRNGRIATSLKNRLLK